MNLPNLLTYFALAFVFFSLSCIFSNRNALLIQIPYISYVFLRSLLRISLISHSRNNRFSRNCISYAYFTYMSFSLTISFPYFTAFNPFAFYLHFHSAYSASAILLTPFRNAAKFANRKKKLSLYSIHLLGNNHLANRMRGR